MALPVTLKSPLVIPFSGAESTWNVRCRFFPESSSSLENSLATEVNRLILTVWPLNAVPIVKEDQKVQNEKEWIIGLYNTRNISIYLSMCVYTHREIYTHPHIDQKEGHRLKIFRLWGPFW